MAELRYHLAMPEPHTHLLQVEVRLAGGDAVELAMPSWTPGSYLMREFARNVQDFEATDEDGQPLGWRKTDKNTWRVEAHAAREVRARYRVYANELSVRTSHLDASHASVNGASVFMLAVGREGEPITLRVDAPEGWRVTTTLPRDGRHAFRAEHYDQLVDCPLEIGTHELLEWEIDGVPHRFALWGGGDFDRARLIADTTRIIRTVSGMFGGMPYEQYLFILHLLPGGRGGLEHRSCTLLQAERDAFRGDAYEQLLGLVAHEFFHVWNGKRIRPAPLGPFDYRRENYTRNLWVVEGFTTYYTDLILRRAGHISERRYLQRLAESIGRLQLLPGRHHQTLEESSFDAWIRFYRPDAHTPNAQVSYYHKGALVSLLLDMRIRRATGGERSLDDLLQLLWERYGQHDRGFPEDPAEGIQALAEEVAGECLSGFFQNYVRGTEELDYQDALRVAGLRLEETPDAEAPRATGEAAPEAATEQPSEQPAEHGRQRGLAGTQPAPARPARVVGGEKALGLRVRDDGGRVHVTHVLAGTPAYRAGVNVHDDIVAVAGLQVRPADFAAAVERCTPGETVELSVFRRGELLMLPVCFEPLRTPALRIRAVDRPTDAQAAAFRGWLATETAPRDLDSGAETR